LACSPKPATGGGAGAKKGAASLSSSATNQKDNTSSSTSTQTSTARPEVPNYQSADLGKNFNTSSPNKLFIKPVADKDKIFLVQLINAYRPIWLNLSKKLEDRNGFWKMETAFFHALDNSIVGAWSKDSFPSLETQTDTMSIHQPLVSVAGSEDMASSAERGDDFKTIGHTFSDALTYPSLPTAVLSLYAIPYDDPNAAALSPPIAYKNIYNRIGPLTEDVLASCKRVNEAYTKGAFPEQADNLACNGVTSGGSGISNYLNVQMGGNTFTGVGSLDNFYQMQTLNIWMPVPPAGYQCLGLIVTNTPDQPATSADAGGVYAQSQMTFGTSQTGQLQEQAKWDYPVYCVLQKYVVEGQLAPLASNGEVDIYRIAVKDPNGISNQNLFWAFPTATPDADRQALKVYVLNKNFVKQLPDIDVTKAK
jgi:hypothetical protein